ncbi:hypothetical protein PCAR4_210127 [Paraburkholderia caribensis]|nr:hypothetical protein PCAR4_210127 [Paraburkholderia caribensis]
MFIGGFHGRKRVFVDLLPETLKIQSPGLEYAEAADGKPGPNSPRRLDMLVGRLYGRKRK